MTNAREIVARLYLVISMALGIPCLALFAAAAWETVQLHLMRPGKTSPSVATGNLLIDLLVAGASLAGKAFALGGAAAEWVMRFIAIISFLIAVGAAILFGISRGVHAGRTWARVAGILVAVVPLFCSFVVITSFRRPLPMSLGALGMAASAYVIWALGWRFA